jgi:hypothetical protein
MSKPTKPKTRRPPKPEDNRSICIDWKAARASREMSYLKENVHGK